MLYAKCTLKYYNIYDYVNYIVIFGQNHLSAGGSIRARDLSPPPPPPPNESGPSIRKWLQVHKPGRALYKSTRNLLSFSFVCLSFEIFNLSQWLRVLINSILVVIFFLEMSCSIVAASMACVKTCRCCRDCCKSCTDGATDLTPVSIIYEWRHGGGGGWGYFPPGTWERFLDCG